MPGKPVRYGVPNPSDPTLHDLPPLRVGSDIIAVQLQIRRGEDSMWRGRLIFGSAVEEGSAPATADIFCATTENDLWECVNDLRDHHVRDLYRSVAE